MGSGKAYLEWADRVQPSSLQRDVLDSGVPYPNGCLQHRRFALHRDAGFRVHAARSR